MVPGKVWVTLLKPYMSSPFAHNKSYDTDINECLAKGGLGTCQQNCTNTNGSYYCSCKTGYNLSADGYNCSGENPDI